MNISDHLSNPMGISINKREQDKCLVQLDISSNKLKFEQPQQNTILNRSFRAPTSVKPLLGSSFQFFIFKFFFLI